MEVIPDEEEIAIDVVPLATNQMHKSFDREDLEDLYKLVKARYGSTRPVESMDYLLWNDLKTMFEPHVEDEIWKLQQRKEISPYTTYNYRYAEQEASVTAALIDVNAAQSKLVLLEEVTTASGITTAEGVNAASEEVSTTELVSTAYVICMRYFGKGYV
ncbi:hypothetical protein Tco_1189378 [Tanacetum coccineum]